MYGLPMQIGLNNSNRLHSIVKYGSLALFLLYLAWNGFWLLRGEIPPSILYFFTAIPCPTTGCMRSLTSLWNGDFIASLQWNPFTIPYIFLLAVTLVFLRKTVKDIQLPRLPAWLGYAWIITLSSGWIAKIWLDMVESINKG
ncbi:DUF2752 domain-containing protein [bacterium]|nr:DUF2752 domain-containing protein [bacterium]